MKPCYAAHSRRYFISDGSVEKRHDIFFHDVDSNLIKNIFYNFQNYVYKYTAYKPSFLLR
mgnify:FL=1